MLYILKKVATYIKVLRNDFEAMIKKLDDTIHNVHQKFEIIVKVSQSSMLVQGTWTNKDVS